jgi:glutathione reductase (NADPH)
VVVGAGYIAVELAGILQALGSKVSLVIRGTHLLRAFDPLIMEKVTENLELGGVEIKREATVRNIAAYFRIEF